MAKSSSSHASAHPSADASTVPAPGSGDAAPEASRQAPSEAVARAVEAILLSVDRPIPASALAEGVLHQTAQSERSSGGSKDEAKQRQATRDEETLIDSAVGSLNAAYEATGRTFRIEQVAGGYRVMTIPELATAVAAFHRARQSARLTRAGVETLAIIAYKQPMTRASLESIRGVACGEVLRTLVDRRLVTIRGRAEELGRPLLYGTTKQFLDVFGLGSLKDLPSLVELKFGLAVAESSGHSAPATNTVSHESIGMSNAVESSRAQAPL